MESSHKGSNMPFGTDRIYPTATCEIVSIPFLILHNLLPLKNKNKVKY